MQCNATSSRACANATRRPPVRARAQACLPHRGRLALRYATAAGGGDWLVRAALHHVVLANFPFAAPDSVRGFATCTDIASGGGSLRNELSLLTGDGALGAKDYIASSLERNRLNFNYTHNANPPASQL